ncbi:MAG: DUF2797 domain-containing protein [Gammaproteobacteria bacterium]|nr:DUF2797 domain-containing protein [Gammaproteobacteria bacterium]
MTSVTGHILKMRTHHDEPVRYQLPIADEYLDVNGLIDTHITLRFDGIINCIKCERQINKSFGQGFCYPCFRSAPEASECILRPELCRAHEGEARDMEWARRHCLQEHIVYLAKSSAIKVGITRGAQVPTRWMDQGATEAIVFAKTPNRYTAGLVEVAMKAHLTDRTNWRRMLKNEIAEDDLVAIKTALTAHLDNHLHAYLSDDNLVYTFNYPVTTYPEKVSSVGFDKCPVIEGKLLGIKGQYLLLDNNRVLNIRKHQGYCIQIDDIA